MRDIGANARGPGTRPRCFPERLPGRRPDAGNGRSSSRPRGADAPSPSRPASRGAPCAVRTVARLARRVLVASTLVGTFAGALAGCAAPVVPGADAPPAPLRAETDDWTGTVRPPAAPARSVRAAPERTASRSRGPAAPVDPAAHRVTVDAVRVPLASLLFLLARDARLELVPHAELDALVTYRATDRPLGEVLQALVAQASFHWRIDGARLVVRGDGPWSETYAVDYLNLDRTTRSSVGLATRVGTMSAPGGFDSGIANSSETLVENVAEHRFFASLAADLDGLLAARDPDGGFYSLNREAGLVTVHGSADAHRAVRTYLDTLIRAARRQVLIEASVVEVTLADRFSAGIDWQRLANGINGVSAAQLLTGVAPVGRDTIGRIAAPNALATLVQSGADGELSATLSLLETFGDVRILSRPRILALNNQASVLKVVDNRVYFTVEVERLVTEETDQIVTGTQIHTVPVGLVMNVTPHIAADGTVMLNVRPTLSRILGFVDDPNPQLAAARVRNGVPEIQVREMESMLRVASGEVAIIGGLMQDAVRDTDRGIPGLDRVPLLGRLFSSKRRERDRSELLVVLRPTVLDPGDAAPPPLSAPRVPGRTEPGRAEPGLAERGE